MDKDKSRTCLSVYLYLSFNKSAMRGNEGGGRAGVVGRRRSRPQQFHAPDARCHYPHLNRGIVTFLSAVDKIDRILSRWILLAKSDSKLQPYF